MEKEALLQDKQYRWVSKIFFSVVDSPETDINPFSDISQFLNAKIGDLKWGKDAKTAKEKFTKNISNIFGLYEFVIPTEEISKGLLNDGQKIKDLVTHLCSIGQFPKK